MEKTNMFQQIFTGTTLLLLSVYFSAALNFDGAKEQPCFKINETVPTDLNWIKSVKTWYYPLMSRYDLYHGAIDLAEKSTEELQENELYYDSCITWEMREKSFVTHGFNGHNRTYDAKFLDASLESYEFFTEGGNAGTCYTTLTDNKTFTFAAGCLSDNQMVWGVVSPHKTLPEETVKLIHDHAGSLGFKREFFTGLQYDSCQSNEVDNLAYK